MGRPLGDNHSHSENDCIVTVLPKDHFHSKGCEFSKDVYERSNYGIPKNHTNENNPERSTEIAVHDEFLIPALAAILNQVISKSYCKTITSFHSSVEPSISIVNYMERLSKFFKCSNECFIFALIYMDRLIKKRPDFALGVLNIHRLLATSVVVAAKFFEDTYYSNGFYSRIAGLPLRELNQLEVKLMTLLDYRLHVLPTEFKHYRLLIVESAYYRAFSLGRYEQLNLKPAIQPDQNSASFGEMKNNGRSMSNFTQKSMEINTANNCQYYWKQSGCVSPTPTASCSTVSQTSNSSPNSITNNTYQSYREKRTLMNTDVSSPDMKMINRLNKDFPAKSAVYNNNGRLMNTHWQMNNPNATNDTIKDIRTNNTLHNGIVDSNNKPVSDDTHDATKCGIKSNSTQYSGHEYCQIPNRSSTCPTNFVRSVNPTANMPYKASAYGPSFSGYTSANMIGSSSPMEEVVPNNAMYNQAYDGEQGLQNLYDVWLCTVLKDAPSNRSMEYHGKMYQQLASNDKPAYYRGKMMPNCENVLYGMEQYNGTIYSTNRWKMVHPRQSENMQFSSKLYNKMPACNIGSQCCPQVNPDPALKWECGAFHNYHNYDSFYNGMASCPRYDTNSRGM